MHYEYISARNQYQFTRPPKLLSRPGPRLDTFSLVPASLLTDLSAYQALSDRQPKRTAIRWPLLTPRYDPSIPSFARVLQADGMQVRRFTSTRP